MNNKGKAIVAGTITTLLALMLLASGARRPKLNPIDYTTSGSQKYAAMIRISSRGGLCTATVIARNYAITAGHCVQGHIGDKFKISGVIVGEQEAKPVTTALAVRLSMYGGIDVGLLKGNFQDFHYAPLETGEVQYQPIFLSCGYAGGSVTHLCRVLEMPQAYGFTSVAKGNLIPGMSGGPIIDPVSGKVVGVNSAQDANVVFFTPTTKVLSFFGLDYIDED